MAQNLSVLDSMRKYEQEGIALRRWFHMHPESSLKEYETIAKVREELERAGIRCLRAGETGLVAEIEGAKPSAYRHAMALRADIDALEIQEENQTDYRSQRDGLMHACGHDAHAAALIIAGKWLQANRERFSGVVRLIFQPAEEIGQGAEQILQSGTLAGTEAVFGLHVTTQLESGRVALTKGMVMAGANYLNIVVKGKSGHAASPHEAVDAIVAGAAIVNALQEVVSREFSPLEPAVLSIGTFHAGTRSNIVANRAELGGSVRIASEEAGRRIEESIRRVAHSVGGAYRAEVETQCGYIVPALINSEELYPTVLEAYRGLCPGKAPVEDFRQMATDDFAVYSNVAPIFYAFVGARAEPYYPHHHELFHIDESSILLSAALHAAFALTFLNQID